MSAIHSLFNGMPGVKAATTGGTRDLWQPPRLAPGAKQSVTQWRFIPAREGDPAVTAWGDIPILFQLRS
ncbi:MAG: hypothetical protein ACRCRW_11810 [Aeromonadaceae bacterium]